MAGTLFVLYSKICFEPPNGRSLSRSGLLPILPLFDRIGKITQSLVEFRATIILEGFSPGINVVT